MNPFFAYLIKSSVSIVLFYSLFRLIMRNDRTHTLNRFLLLGILMMSALIPFLNIQFFYEEVPLKPVETIREFVSTPVFIERISAETVQPLIETASSSVNPWLVFYLLVISALLFRLLLGVVKVIQIIGRAEKRRLQKIVLAVVKDIIQPFSFLNKVVLSEKDFTENKNIIVAHEHAHIKQLHTIDLMVCEVSTVMHFFNPFMWLLRRDLKLIHEYQADQAVLNKGIDAKKYQLLVLQKSVGERRFAMANHFTQKPILKRLKMMQQNNRKQWAAFKLILFVPLLVLLLQAFARPELITSTDEFIPVKYMENETNSWLQKWTVENIGQGVFHPYGVKAGEFPSRSKNKLRIELLRNNRILFDQQSIKVSEIKEYFNSCLQGYNPVKGEELELNEKDIPELGKVKVIDLLVNFGYDKMLSTDSVNPVLKLVGEAYFETKQKLAQRYFKQDYLELDELKTEIIDIAIPIRFSCSHMIVYESNPVEIILQKNGKLLAWNKEYTIDEIEQELINKKATLAKPDKDGYRYSLLPDLVIEDGVSEKQITQMKEVLRNAKILNINYSDGNKESERNTKSSSGLPPSKSLTLKQDCELSIPEGFSPNDDGVHDFFQIGCLYPNYPNAKLMIFNSKGQKLFEKENYGNPEVWGKENVWWNGTSANSLDVDKDGRLKAGYYNYVLKLGNGTVKKGSVLLANSPLPRVLEVLPENSNYDVVEFEGNYGLVVKNGMYGLINRNGEEIIPAEYDALEFDGYLAMSVKNGLYGLIKLDGTVVIPNEYDALEFDGNLGMSVKNGKLGLIKLDGTVVIPNEYDALEFDGNLGMSVKNGKIGLIKLDGTVVISNEYDALEFDGNLGVSVKNGKVGLIKLDGTVLIPNEYDALEFDGNLGMSVKNGKIGLIKLDGTVVIPNEYDALEFDGSLGVSVKNGKVGLIKLDGTVVISNEYDAIDVEGNRAVVIKDGKKKTIKL